MLWYFLSVDQSVFHRFRVDVSLISKNEWLQVIIKIRHNIEFQTNSPEPYAACQTTPGCIRRFVLFCHRCVVGVSYPHLLYHFFYIQLTYVKKVLHELKTLMYAWLFRFKTRASVRSNRELFSFILFFLFFFCWSSWTSVIEILCCGESRYHVPCHENISILFVWSHCYYFSPWNLSIYMGPICPCVCLYVIQRTTLRAENMENIFEKKTMWSRPQNADWERKKIIVYLQTKTKRLSCEDKL